MKKEEGENSQNQKRNTSSNPQGGPTGCIYTQSFDQLSDELIHPTPRKYNSSSHSSSRSSSSSIRNIKSKKDQKDPHECGVDFVWKSETRRRRKNK